MKQRFLSALFFYLFLHGYAAGQTINIPGPAGSGQFGRSITVLTNGNYVVADPLWDNGALADVGAVYLYNGLTHALISTLTGSRASDQVGSGGVKALTNGNFVVSSPQWSTTGIGNTGAATWGSGTTGVSGAVSSSNSLIGGTTGDFVSGNGNITILGNGNYVVISLNWHNGAIANAGAVTWCNGATGTAGTVSSSNSLVGTGASDQVGNGGITVLTNNNYVVSSTAWDNGAITDAGAATWGSGTSGISGVVNSSNSLVGSTVNDKVSSGKIAALSNGNYVVNSNEWDNGIISDAGAVTWANGTAGITGAISSSNSLVGSTANDAVGLGGVTLLTNGNYVVSSSGWDDGAVTNAGAATWGNGAAGTTGTISSSNSLVGNTNNSFAGQVITALTNGNYVVGSPNWDNGAITNVGAVTWGNGTTGTSGIISSSNSLVGSTVNDFIGRIGFGGTINNGIFALRNGNYVVSSTSWDDGAISQAGAVTWGNGTTGITGVVSSSNSLVGSKASDQVGHYGIIPLINGNYVVQSPFWDNGAIADAGAVTWGNGTSGISGAVSSSNSLVGSTAFDQVGFAGGTVVALSNGNYVTGNPFWDNGALTNAGAATWGNGTTGISGTISSSNSLVGTSSNDMLGDRGIAALTNGNYVVIAQQWSNGINNSLGAVTWGNGSTGITGPISSNNSLIGSKGADMVGSTGVRALGNGNYAVHSERWDNGVLTDAGAVTWGSGTTGVSGTINTCNSVPGLVATSILNPVYNNIYEYEIVGKETENIVSIFYPSGQPLAVHLDNVTQTISGTGDVFFVNNVCRLLAKVNATGASPIAGSTTAKVWIESSQPASYVKRHVEITPAAGAGTATGKVTLYFTQAEFDDFNAVNTIKLPQHPSDATGKANLRVEKRNGTSSNGSGLPSSYNSGITTIDPADADINWNSTLNRWEISFDVTGFSGFFVKTTPGLLPVNWLSVTGKLDERNHPVLNWKVQEQNITGYQVEKSNDGRSFIPAGMQNSKGDGTNTYSFTEAAALSGTAYYRIKQTGADGRSSYSAIIRLGSHTANGINIYPNPVKDIAVISGTRTGDKLVLVNATGRVLNQFMVSNSSFTVDMSKYSSGIYYLKTKEGKSYKITKQ